MDMVPLSADAGLGDVVERINANTAAIEAGLTALQAIANSYSAALPASVADRKALHDLVDGLRRDLTTTTTAAGTTASAVTALAGKQARAASGMVPAITSVLGSATADVSLTWPTPWPDTSYTVLPVIEVPASLLGKITVAVKSKTAAGAVLTVTSTAVLASGQVPVRAISVP